MRSHPYCTVALAPAIGGLVATGGVCLWQVRRQLVARLGLTAMIGGSGAWSFALLSQDPTWLPWLRWTIVIATSLSAVMFLSDRLSTGGG